MRSLVATLLICSASFFSGLAQDQGAASLFGTNGVNPTSVREGPLSAGYFHASIAAIAKASPETLRKAIGRNPQGGYRVHFASGPDEVIFQQDLDYRRARGLDSSDGDWVLVLMQGYAQHAIRLGMQSAAQRADDPIWRKVLPHWLDRDVMVSVAFDRAVRSVIRDQGLEDSGAGAFKQAWAAEQKNAGIPSLNTASLNMFANGDKAYIWFQRTINDDGEIYGGTKCLGQGGLIVRVLEAFMGPAATLLVADHESTMKTLRALHNGGVALTAGAWNVAPDASIGNSRWWANARVYTVLDFSEASRSVTLRNPSGRRPDPDGIFTIPLAQFLKAFESCSYSQ